MALMLLGVFLVGVFAAAADDVPITWWPNNHAVLPCVVPLAERLQPRRPPPPLDTDDTPRSKTYMWRRGEEYVSSKRVSASGALEVSRRGRKEGEGVYQCLFRHYGGVVMGYPAHLKFATIDKFSMHPENTTARSGQPFLLSCSISSAPPATVSWLKDEHPLQEDERYHILQNQLLITDVTTADEGSYRCTATNRHLNKSRTSYAGKLLLQYGDSDQDPAFLPVSHEAAIFAPRGSRVVLPCPVTGWPRPKLIWEHTPPDERVGELDVVDEVFVIRSLEEDQQGVYTCGVEGNSELKKTFSVTLTEPAQIMVPPTSREVRRASTVRFNCTAGGRPEPVVTWYKDGQPLQITGRINLRKSTDGQQRTELVISGVTSDDAGVYQCFAQNVAATDSYWAMLNVTGADAAAPTNVRCWPVGDRKIKVAWDKPTVDKTVVAYTLHGTSEEEKARNSLPGHPLIEPEETVTVESPFIPYRFQVRAYVIKSTASDLSAPAICQGQGVPIKMATLGKDQVIVSWRQFAKENPGVVEWILQTKSANNDEYNITLNAAVTNYSLTAPPSQPLQVRVLGSRSLNWLQQDLSLLRWWSTANAGTDLDAGDVPPIPDRIEVTELSPREFTVIWQCEEPDSGYSYQVCVKGEDMEQTCMERNEMFATFTGLLPGTEYKVSVQARITNRALSGPFSQPYTVVTPLESPLRFKELSAHHINSSMILVSWNGAPAHYRVHYSAQLKLPVEQWDSVDTNGSSVLVPVIDPGQRTFLMVTGYDPLEHSKIETVPPYVTKPEDLDYEITESGIRVWWSGDEPRVVSYAQNITTPLEQWTTETVSGDSIELPVNLSLPTYVLVAQSTNRRGKMLTIDPSPPRVQDSTEQQLNLKLGLILGLGILTLILMALAAVCIWRKRKKALSPVRSRRRNAESNEENVEEEAEMKVVGGAGARRLANGGARGAGEPLLNGHVRITENPTSKTPNGKVKKDRRRRFEAAFDVSRYEDPDITQETVLEADTSAASYNLLDTSRRPEFDLSRSSHEISANNSFAKLPDDNMNSELTRSSFQFDNSKIQPTLQPNG